ncbi:hypothetical protein F4777DRAFT_582919 [Nemania sp. FL0916]|nr:hypothetical protein F4777DRAFT_582919 [Nemania sp. FL0916]
MQFSFIQAVLITGAIAALMEPRQVIVTVTEGIPPASPVAPSPVPLSAAPVPWEQGSAAVPAVASESSSSSSGNLALPPLQPPTATAGSGPSVSASPGSIGAKCGKGYTYCGYMLTGFGHNFAQTDIEQSYCNGLPELCASGKHKTNADQAVFVCMSDQPSTVKLLCACSGTCLNNATTNFIAHCDKACVNA